MIVDGENRACRQMADASNKEICELGVPFFCTGTSENLTKDELLPLQKKMLQLFVPLTLDHILHIHLIPLLYFCQNGDYNQ